MGSARATRAVFRALAENIERTEKFQMFGKMSCTKRLDARRVQRHPRRVCSRPIRRRCSWSTATTTGPTSRKVWPAFKQLKVPATHHQLSTFNHQRPQSKPAGKWIERFEEWLADSGFLKKP